MCMIVHSNIATHHEVNIRSIGLNFSEMASGTTEPHPHTTPQSIHHTPDHTHYMFVMHYSSFPTVKVPAVRTAAEVVNFK